MEVFSKSYLKAVVEVQGQLFDDFARERPDCDTDDFITAYMTSKTRAYIDEGQPYVATMNAHELMRWYLEKSGYQPKPGESMKGFMPDWIGRFYALCQWMEKKSSREIFKQVPLSFLKIGYAGLHDLELDLAVAKVCGKPSEISAEPKARLRSKSLDMRGAASPATNV